MLSALLKDQRDHVAGPIAFKGDLGLNSEHRKGIARLGAQTEPRLSRRLNVERSRFL